MSRPINLIEVAAFTGMAGWFVGHLLYTLPFPSLRRHLDRFNQGLWFANWSVFGAGDQRAETTTYTVEFRDHGGLDEGQWTQVAQGRPWRWHAFLWQPERRVADRLHRLAEGIARTPDLDSSAAQVALQRRLRLIARYVAVHSPPAPTTKRELRIRMTRAVIADRPEGTGANNFVRSEERVLLTFFSEANDR